MTFFKDKTIFITGASRGIGKSIGLALAKDGANIVIAAKTTTPHPKLPGTIFTAAKEIEEAGGQCLPLCVDIRYEDQVKEAIQKAVQTFGGIDILVNNASAIQLTGTVETEMKRYDLMHQINIRGTFLTSKYCIPELEKADTPHLLNLSPPLNMDKKWFAPHVAYTMSKYGMSMCVLGMAEELRPKKIAVNALWPKTVIKTAAVQNLLGGNHIVEKARAPEILGDAAYKIFQKKGPEWTGNFFIDEDFLKSEGVEDFSKYSKIPNEDLIPDFFL